MLRRERRAGESMSWVDFRHRMSQHFSFSQEESRALIPVILVLSFIVGFNDGSETFSMFSWLRNYLNSLIIVALAVLVHVCAQKAAGIYLGQKVEYRLWAPAIIAGIVLALISNGEWTVVVAGGIVAHAMTAARIGRFRYGFSYNDLGMVAAAGPLANVGLAILLKALTALPGGGLLGKAILINMLFALFAMLPIPPLPGSMVLFASRSLYVFLLASLAAVTALLVYTSNAVLALGGAILAGFAVFLVYFALVETK